MNQLNIFWETWLDVVGYEGLYQVNGRGDVKSLNYNHTGKEKILKPFGSNGYKKVILCKNAKNEALLIHRLVYESFYGNIPDGMEIDHIDTIRDNNTVENLRCVTHKENHANPITKKKQDDASKKRAQDPEWLRKNAEANKKKAKTQKWQKNHAEGIKKRSKNQEWRKNQAEALKKLHANPEWRKNVSEANKKSNKLKKSKPVLQYTIDGEFVKEWPSAAEIERELGYSNANISKCCLGKCKQAYGFVWKHKEVA